MNQLFAFQIVPGSDELLGYCTTMEEAVTEAVAHRKELMKDQALHDEDNRALAPIALYELSLQPLSFDLMLPVLNKRQELSEVWIKEMTPVGTIE